MIRFFALLLLLTTPVHAADIAMDVDEKDVNVSLGFTGQDITVFGVDRAGVIDNIVITGPAKRATVRKKSNIGGAWINTDQAVFADIPGYYVFTHTNTIRDMATTDDKDDNGDFTNAFVRNMRDKTLYDTDQQTMIEYKPSGLFSVHVQLPAGVPVGQYMITAYDAGQNAIAQTDFTVQQTGANASIREFAHDYSFFYALCCIGLAMGAGWIANRLRKTG